MATELTRMHHSNRSGRSERARRHAANTSESDLLLEYYYTRDPDLRDRIVADHVPLAKSVARRFAGRGAEIDDLRQVALLALVEAVDRFDPTRGLAFSTFAVPTVLGALKRYLRDRAWSIRPPRRLQERYLAVSAVIETLTNELGRRPSDEEVATRAACSPDEVREALGVADVRHIDRTLTNNGYEPRTDAHTVDHDVESVETRMIVDSLLAQLPERERAIVKMRFFDEMAQRSIAQTVGLSQMQISRLLTRSLGELRDTARTRLCLSNFAE
jgi:RNA polymerase sigma-B factor